MTAEKIHIFVMKARERKRERADSTLVDDHVRIEEELPQTDLPLVVDDPLPYQLRVALGET